MTIIEKNENKVKKIEVSIEDNIAIFIKIPPPNSEK